jgi:DNA polymerase alpha-associated DNA helicase A
MNETISAFPSVELYGSALINHDSVARRRLVDLPSIKEPTSEDSTETLEPTLVFFDTAGSEMFERLEGDGEDAAIQKGSIGEGSRYNENEAEIVAKWARKLVREATTHYPEP